MICLFKRLQLNWFQVRIKTLKTLIELLIMKNKSDAKKKFLIAEKTTLLI